MPNPPDPAQATTTLQLPSLTCKWGSYDKIDPEVADKVIGTIATALGAGGSPAIITRRIAVEKAREVFPQIENVDAVLEELEKTEEEKAQRELDAATTQIEAAARARGAGPNDPSAPGAKGGTGGRPQGGQNNAG